MRAAVPKVMYYVYRSMFVDLKTLTYCSHRNKIQQNYTMLMNFVSILFPLDSLYLIFFLFESALIRILFFLVLGGWGNQRIILRKRIDGAVLADVYWPNVLSEYKKKKFVFQISKEGDIYLYSEDNQYKPILTAYDPQPYEIEFLSFKNKLTENIDFLWGNNPDLPLDKVIQILLDENYGKVAIMPSYNNWVQVKPVLNLKCKCGLFFVRNM